MEWNADVLPEHREAMLRYDQKKIAKQKPLLDEDKLEECDAFKELKRKGYIPH